MKLIRSYLRFIREEDKIDINWFSHWSKLNYLDQARGNIRSVSDTLNTIRPLSFKNKEYGRASRRKY